jgi:hypothetical protein
LEKLQKNDIYRFFVPSTVFSYPELQASVKGGAKVDHWGGAKGYQQRER